MPGLSGEGSVSLEPAPLPPEESRCEACRACVLGKGPLPRHLRDATVTKDSSVVMSSKKCFVMFSQSTERPGTFLWRPAFFISDPCPREKSNADELQTGSAHLKPDSSARAPRGTPTQHPVMDGLCRVILWTNADNVTLDERRPELPSIQALALISADVGAGQSCHNPQ